MNMFSEEIACLIEEFTGPNFWRLHFSSKVLPRLNKGWKLVGRWAPYMDYQGGDPCMNCYLYGSNFDHLCYETSNCVDTCMTWACKEEFYCLDYWKWIFSCHVVHHLNIR